MKKKLKTRRFICVILCLGMLFSMQSNVFATDIALIGSEPTNFSAINSELNTPEFKALLRTFLDDDAIRTSTDAELMNAKIGNAFSYIETSPSISAASEVNANTSVRYYPIINNGKFLAIVGVAEYNGRRTFTISEAYAPYLNMLIAQSGKSSVQIIESEIGLYAISGTKMISLSGSTMGRSVNNPQTNQLYSNAVENIVNVNADGLSVSSLVNSANTTLVDRSNYSYELYNFPRVNQEQYWCWAGCISAIAKFYGNTGATPEYVNQSAQLLGYAEGTTDDIVNLLNVFLATVVPYRPSSFNGVLSPNAIISYINNQKPFMIGAWRTDSGTVPLAAHVTVGIGYATYTEGTSQLIQVKMMNPATGQYEWTSVSNGQYYEYYMPSYIDMEGYFWHDTIVIN